MNVIKKNYLYNVMYQLVAIIVPLIVTPYVSRILGSDNIVVVSYYTTLASFFVMFGMLGIANYGNRSIAKCRDDQECLINTFSEIYTLQIVLSLGSTIVYIIFLG